MPLMTSPLDRRAFLTTAAAAGVALATGARAEEAWPTHPVRVIVPYPPGGSTDVLTRILMDKFKDMLGQNFVVENRGGAGGNIGIAVVSGAPGDGYTMGAATIGHFAINQYLYKTMPFDAEKDLLPASLTWELPNVFVVASDRVPVKSVAEFIAYAKQKGNVTFGSPGVGTSPHLSGVLFAKTAGINATHVPFRGAAQTIPAMLSGDVTFAIDNLASYVGTIQSGQMRALAVTSAQRWPTMKDVPTMEEAGVKDFVVTSWAAFVFPKGTPRPIIDKVAATMKTIAADDAVQKRFQVAGARCISSTMEEARAYAAREAAKWKDVVALSGAKVE
ncbi:MAG TPA: tripartite tricarboxylate transporter substrate binding protein [Pseudolabrys sp.]|jgi:tripartite-type tricarboxylate transporter receptor subunit TctC|nr:tripartite tricarboxylate transporter substrate binding protein [Pseudolabrys sp.]HEX2537533.1 tripartite tricarboxylate transporter substrate binding protein [Pseudolabrys sp.]